MSQKKPYKLFEVFGVELEYMIVDRDTLAVKPVCDLLLKEVTGEFISDYENAEIAWSNELVTHVVEIKSNGPAPALPGLAYKFHANVLEINKILKNYNAVLMPTGTHPFMDPFKETNIWPHEHNEIYSLYNRIFDCRGHGWSNLQSTHINLPFYNDEEFGKLHAAIRLLLPIIPALSASTPIMDGKNTGYRDGRLEAYRHNQKKIPSIAGKVIPEAVFTQKDYYERIFNRVMRDIKPYDTEGVLSHHFLNSRGAIARFDRNAIEIRIIDIQECPAADLAILETIVQVLKATTEERWVGSRKQMAWSENELSDIFLTVIKDGEQAKIKNLDYLEMFGMPREVITAAKLWKALYEQVKDKLSAESAGCMQVILEEGTLSSRILRKLETNMSHEGIVDVYRQLITCLETNSMFK